MTSPTADILERIVRREAAAREAQAREAVCRALRPRLRWLVDHPRLLGWAWRLGLARRPVVPVEPGPTARQMAAVGAALAKTGTSAREIAERWSRRR